MKAADKKTVKIILSIILLQGAILLLWIFTSDDFISYIGFTELSSISPIGWGAAIALVLTYVWGAAGISTVRQHMFSLDRLKCLAILGAIVSGIFEEILFRKLLMDFLQQEGFGHFVQILVSGAAFGVAHLVRGGKSLSAGINATFYTFFLGVGLALVYVLSDRNLAVCIIAHIFVTGLIEPGLIKSAVLNKLGYFKQRE